MTQSFMLEFGQRGDGNCARCGNAPVLVTVQEWQTHPEDDEDDEEQDFVEPHGETSGHYCPECRVLVAVFIHVPQGEN